MDRRPVRVTADASGLVTLEATCTSCGARHVVTIANVGAFTRQTVVAILGDGASRVGAAGLRIASSCGRCLDRAGD